MKTIARYASLVKFSHTIFALPFAFIGFVYAYATTDNQFTFVLLAKVLLAMVTARNMAMGFNRWLDRDIDAKNERTSMREIPAGKISPKNALLFVIINAVIFFAVTFFINQLAFYLSPIVPVVLLGYSYTKRFTSWCHLVLGASLAIAPTGAYIAVTGTFAFVPLLLSGLVLTWVSGFDIIYSLQDIEFDRSNGLHSIPARFGVKGGLAISIILHLISIYTAYLIGVYMHAGTWYWVGAGIFVAVLIYQHICARPARIEKIGDNFGLINGVASVCYAVCAVMDLVL